ncbi:hypothetical protein FF38_14261, partial [Lucilia cuprina]
MLDGDTELKELIMNLTGTLIFGEDNKVTTTIPKANRQELIKALMYGGTIRIEGCVSTVNCLELRTKTITISEKNGLNSLVNTMITQIQSKLREDTALTEAEKGFIQSTSIPILRYLVDPMQLNLNVSLLPALSDYIAYDILLQYLTELIDQAKIALASRNYPEEPMKVLRQNVAEASRQLEELQQQVNVKSNVLMELERQMSYLRQQTSSQLQERFQQNTRFNLFEPDKKGSLEWDSMFRIVFLISAMTFFVVYIRGHDPKEILKFAAVSILISSVLLVPKRTVQVIDRTDPTGVYLIDNVPLGLAVPARFISSIGTSLTELYETVFHTPNSLSYSKTGMLFGADLVGNMSDIMTVNGDLAELMGMYAKNCVIGDILINHKYSFQELMNSRDPYTLIFKNPSPLRGVMVPQGNLEATPAGFWTCEKLAKEVLMPKIGIDTSPNGKTWDYTVRSIFGGRPDANVLYSAMLGDSYREYYKGSKTASQLMRNSVVMNALKHGISAYSAQSGDTASLINLSSTSSYNKMRLSWATSSKVATSFVPLLNTILFSFVIALFPIFILLAVIHVLTGKMLFNYIMSIIYLQSWAPMFAILNYATSFYLSRKTGGMDFNLGNQATIQQIHSDIGLIAGWLSISIPFIAVAIVRGLGPAIAQAGNYLGTAINSSATASSSQAADGTWSFNNMQTDNVTGNKWDTNYGFRDGQMTRQLASGASTTRTQDGQVVHNVQEGMSKLPVSIRGSQAISSTLQQQARHAEADAASYLQSYQHSVNSSFNQLSQFSQQRGNSTTLSKQSDSGETASASAAAMKMDSAVSSYARSKGINKQQAYSELMDKTT